MIDPLFCPHTQRTDGDSQGIKERRTTTLPALARLLCFVPTNGMAYFAVTIAVTITVTVTVAYLPRGQEHFTAS